MLREEKHGRRQLRRRHLPDNTNQTSEKKEESLKESEVKDEEAEKEKEARKLTKKLRQARELKDKKEQGAALLPEQFEKVIRINELIRQPERSWIRCQRREKGT